MTRSVAILAAVLFLLAGIGLFAIVRQSSEAEANTCMEKCRAEGKSYVSAPTGIAGKFIDGGRTWSEPSRTCQCVNAPAIEGTFPGTK